MTTSEDDAIIDQNDGLDVTVRGRRGAQGERGLPGDSPGNELLAAVQELSNEVKQLSGNLHENYPKRSEVRQDGRKRAGKVLGFGLVLVIVANLITIQTISYCFLNTTVQRHKICSYIPGYDNALAEGDRRLARFQLLISQIEKNRKEIENLKKQDQVLDLRIKQLEAQLNSPTP
jgi:hypothetical protein